MYRPEDSDHDSLFNLRQSTYDGVGRLLDQYRKGDKTEAGKMASERFVTIIPIAPKEKPDGTVNKHYRPEVSKRSTVYACNYSLLSLHFQNTVH